MPGAAVLRDDLDALLRHNGFPPLLREALTHPQYLLYHSRTVL
jgi:hypothetical protein